MPFFFCRFPIIPPKRPLPDSLRIISSSTAMKTISVWFHTPLPVGIFALHCIYFAFFLLLFFCCFGCQRGPRKARSYGLFPGNRLGNGIATGGSATGCDFPGYFRRKFHLLRDFHKSVRRFFTSVVSARCRGFPFPALLPAVSFKYPGIGEILPSRDTVVHDVIDLPDFPLLRLVKGMVQGFLKSCLEQTALPV